MYDQPLYTKDYTIRFKILEFINYDYIEVIVILLEEHHIIMVQHSALIC